MTSYFDETEIKKRVGARMRRRFLFTTHTILAMALVFGFVFHGVFIQTVYSPMDAYWLLWRNITAQAFLIAILPLIFHALWARYRERLAEAIESEIRAAQSKRKHEPSTRLTDDGELWQAEAFGDEKYKRLIQ
jgi:membrane protein implicated in regulation of membrane protease activity